ncbi:hypothetical protein TRICI_002526 [Trichomonascus ciferrii]|uniref:Prenylcysteine lyase domain-containing protein n=1 Tax=Trichomonascus ciferrii TaxID=44093 RepID=A0A642VBZ1_9ASCO|nr:hypothetical protein TRICI_002526 [Trichomonascus ciferrii]
MKLLDYIPGFLLPQLPIRLLGNISGEGPRVAVIGAGAAGSSAAFHLSQLTENADITVFEKNNYIGGRVDHVEIEGKVLELGASIFVDANHILRDSAKMFNLTVVTKEEDKGLEDDKLLGVYNGHAMVFELEWPDHFWKKLTIQMARKFGVLSPYRANRLKSKAVNRFMKIYSDLYFPWSNLDFVVDAVGLREYVNLTAEEWFSERSVSRQYQEDFLQGLTRVNYANNLDKIHSLAAAVCLGAENGTRSIEGGNRQIFEEMCKRSNANVHLNREVRTIAKHGRKWLVDKEPFDYVILAVPWQFSGINIEPSVGVAIPDTEYVKLHVHYVLTKEPISGNKTSFSMLLTTVTPPLAPPKFNSLSHVSRTEAGNHIYKLFTREEMTNDELSEILNGASILHNQHRVWYSYPEMKPVDSFAPVELASNLYYTSGMDPFISTMETNALSGKNVAHLIANSIESNSK